MARWPPCWDQQLWLRSLLRSVSLAQAGLAYGHLGLSLIPGRWPRYVRIALEGGLPAGGGDLGDPSPLKAR